MSLDNEYLYKLILQLTERISHLERTNSITETPFTNISEWISNCKVITEDVEMVYENNGFMYGMQKCIERNHIMSPMPIMICKNTMYVYESNKWEKWSNTSHMYMLITDIWRKFIKIHMDAYPCDEETRDMQRRCILEMRQKLYDVKKNRMELYRWLTKIDL